MSEFKFKDFIRDGCWYNYKDQVDSAKAAFEYCQEYYQRKMRELLVYHLNFILNDKPLTVEEYRKVLTILKDELGNWFELDLVLDSKKGEINLREGWKKRHGEDLGPEIDKKEDKSEQKI